MGYNISGIAVSKNLYNEIYAIENEIGFRLELIEEINFETASSNWKEDGICDIYFGTNGTLIFLSHELSLEAYSLLNINTLTYAISDTSMTFCFHYCENGKIRRSKAEAEGKELRGEGERLDIEYTPTEISEIIWELINQTIGERFMDIDLSAKAYRYRLLNKENIITNNQNTEKVFTSEKLNGNKLKIILGIYKYSKWIIIIGLIFTALSLTKIFDNRFGFLVILFGVFVRKGSSWYMNNRMFKNKN